MNKPNKDKIPLVDIQSTEENEKRQISVLIAGHIPIHFDLHKTMTSYQEEVFKELLENLDQIDIVDIYGVQSPQSQFLVKVIDDDEDTDTIEFSLIWRDTGSFVVSIQYNGNDDKKAKVYLLSYLFARMKIAILTNKYAKPLRRRFEQLDEASDKIVRNRAWYYSSQSKKEKEHE